LKTPLLTLPKRIHILFSLLTSKNIISHTKKIEYIYIEIALSILFFRYLPPYTSFLPVKDDEEIYKKKRNRRGKLLENILFSQLSYLAIFIILVCITERQKLKEDPLNFSLLNIVVEVVRYKYFCLFFLGS
jgi:hypothetical protein